MNLTNKLPQLTLAFWIMKITATTLGETGGDWLSMTMNLGYLSSSLIFFSIFIVLLGAQLLSERHQPLLYWGVIVATSTAGTTLSDYMDRSLQLGYARGAAILISILLLTIGLWHWTCGTVNVNTIRSRRAEVFYWLTILFSNTLGTALGDFLSDDSGLGFVGSWCLVTTLLIAVVLVYRLTKVSHVILFWIAFVLTRPFGATFGDVLTKDPAEGGLAFGRGTASLVLLAILLVAMVVTYRPKVDKAASAR